MLGLFSINTKIYRIPFSYKAQALMALAGAVVMALLTTWGALFARPRDEVLPMYCIAFFSYGAAVFLVWLVWGIRAYDNYVEVTDSHITQHAPGKPPLTVTWSSIVDVKTNSFMQRLELHSNTTTQVLNVEHQVENYDDLRDFISYKTGKTIPKTEIFVS